MVSPVTFCRTIMFPCLHWSFCDLFFFRDKPFQPEVYDLPGKEPSQEIQLHTWMDATLREIADLLKAAIPALSEPCKLMFRIVYPDKIGRMVIRTAGFSFPFKNICAEGLTRSRYCPQPQTEPRRCRFSGQS
jgi:hypothetical protein